MEKFFRKKQKPRIGLAYGMTDVGKKRDGNEDTFLVLPEKHLYIISDGMGGHNAGEVASAQAVAAVRAFLDHQDLFSMNPENIKKALMDAVKIAHDTVLELSQMKIQFSKMGCTLVVAFILDNMLYTCHVGDSRAYVINNEEIIQITADHSVVMELVVLRKLTKEEARRSPLKNRLTQAVGLPHFFNPELSCKELKRDDTVLICTDGLWNMLSDGQIHKLVIQENSAHKLSKKLIDAANNEGGDDNITVIVIKPEVMG